MNFDLTDEQQMLNDSLRRFVTNEYSFEKRSTFIESGKGTDPNTWSALADMGLLAFTYLLTVKNVHAWTRPPHWRTVLWAGGGGAFVGYALYVYRRDHAIFSLIFTAQCLLAGPLAFDAGKALAVPRGPRAKLRVVARGRQPLERLDETIDEYVRILSDILGRRCDADGCLVVTVEWKPATVPEGDALQMSLSLLHDRS